MNEHYYPPIFLTGELPKRNPDEIVWLVLCLGRMGIVLPKDLLKKIYDEFLQVITYESFQRRCALRAETTIRRGYDFVLIDVREGERIRFNDVNYSVSNGKKYLLCSKLNWLDVVVHGSDYTISYYYFDLGSHALATSFRRILNGLNSHIDGERLMYFGHKTIRKDSSEVKVFDRKSNPDLQEDIDVCLRHGLITWKDPLPEKRVRCYVDETGAVRDWSLIEV